jgi:hypothetical protein
MSWSRDNVIRRWASLLVIWASLLGVVAPTPACALQMPDCCPAGSTTPCQNGDQPGLDRQANMACCDAAPVASGLAIAAASSVCLEIHVPNSPDPAVPAAWAYRIHLTAMARASPPPLLISYRENSSLIYLRTVRLRI